MAQQIHRPLILGITSALDSIFNEKRYSDKTLQYLFKHNKQWGSKDRRFVAEGTYDIVRWWRKLNKVLGVDWGKERFSTIELNQVLGVWLLLNNYQVPDLLECDFDSNTIKEAFEKLTELADVESIPDWLDSIGRSELGKAWAPMVKSLNIQAQVYLRVNTLKTDKENLKVLLNKEGIECVDFINAEPDLKLKVRKNVFATEAFKLGLFEVQDWGSQQIATLLEAKPGERVVDACAGAGGKSLHLACEMNNRGKIIALDIHEWKLKELHKRAKRNGIDIIEVRAIEGSKTIKRLHGKCDKLLLDVPCSGLGVLRRNPDTKWKINLERLNELKELQQTLLCDYSLMVKPGGKMVYATCSILPSENEEQVQKFLSEKGKASGWSLVNELKIDPITNDSDGFYAATLTRAKSPQ